MANNVLNSAKTRKNDEFCTAYEYIQKEINAYLEYASDNPGYGYRFKLNDVKFT